MSADPPNLRPYSRRLLPPDEGPETCLNCDDEGCALCDAALASDARIHEFLEEEPDL